jgi:thiamine-phosphate pyrophosphorylase
MSLALDTYLITQENLSAGRRTEAIVDAALAGGVDVVQVREKHRTARTRLEIAETLRGPTAEADVPLIINDRLDIALAVDADGVHLGDDDLPVAVARAQLGEDAIIGRSVSTVEAAEAAERAGADYLGVGAIYTTSSKDVDDEENGIGLDVVTHIADAVDIPLVGIGGVTPERTPDVVEAGADGVAVITAITEAADPERATQKLGEAVERGRRRGGELEGET